MSQYDSAVVAYLHRIHVEDFGFGPAVVFRLDQLSVPVCAVLLAFVQESIRDQGHIRQRVRV